MLTNAYFLNHEKRLRINRSLLAIRAAATNKEKEKVLVIVESPAKARTIQKFLQDMKDDQRTFIVDSCAGHVRDLASNAKSLPKGFKAKLVSPDLRLKTSELGVDVFDNFKPLYVTIPGKEDIVKRLKETSKGVDRIYLATDEDREGEAISWHLIDILNPKVPYEVSFFTAFFSFLANSVPIRELSSMKSLRKQLKNPLLSLVVLI